MPKTWDAFQQFHIGDSSKRCLEGERSRRPLIDELSSKSVDRHHFENRNICPPHLFVILVDNNVKSNLFVFWPELRLDVP